MSTNINIKRMGTIALVILVLAACVYTAVISPKFNLFSQWTRDWFLCL